MLETLFFGGLVGFAIATITSLIGLGIQRRELGKAQAQQRAWEQAQQARQLQWQMQQEKSMREFEHQLNVHIRQLRTEWQVWKDREARRAETLAQEYATATAHAYKEHELAVLPRVEWTPLSKNMQEESGLPFWRPAKLQGTDLSHRDISQRYLGWADLRNAYLVNTNLYMSNLTGACLAGANLTGANLIGANLTDADLNGAVLTGANLLVADLNNTVLVGANLLDVRNLTIEQVYSSLYDTTTKFDPELDITLPRIPEHHTAAPFTPTDESLPAPGSEKVPTPALLHATDRQTAHLPVLPETLSIPQLTEEGEAFAS